ncbi:hypothetical protein H9657_11105 [Cellulomonas sp. Sa3CUA2]|uniref:DUF4352 domain-containing protein n=1 Tax=Cellulomonas avistercoris TaxID=2762242 RepID=A0ABR8QEM4_9CELL|nr:hypothetical protein [Cellulomonas avistercoris]MBD7918820.1 hypothetical protein [Cellulomonas avistercoris]
MSVVPVMSVLSFTPARHPGPGAHPRRTMRIATSTAAAGAALSLGLLLSACSAEPGEVAPVTSSATPTASPAASPTEEPAPAPTQAAKGARENPAVPDVDTVTFSEAGAPVYEVLLSAADFAADDVVSGYYEFNEAPPEGSTYVLLPLTATYRGDATGQAWLDLGVTFVAADGRTFESADAIVPDDLTVTPEVATGGVVRGVLPFLVPQDALAGGMWSVVHEYATTAVPAYWTAI